MNCVAGFSLMPLVFPITGRPAKIVGRTPRSAAGPLAGLPVVDETDPVGEERVLRGNLLLWHLLRAVALPRGGNLLLWHLLRAVALPKGGNLLLWHLLRAVALPRGGNLLLWHLLRA